MDNQRQAIVLKHLLVILVSSKEEQISDLLTQIRAIKGVVTVAVTDATVSISEAYNSTKITVKLLTTSRNIKETLKQLKGSILNIPGVESATLKIKKVETDPHSQGGTDSTETVIDQKKAEAANAPQVVPAPINPTAI